MGHYGRVLSKYLALDGRAGRAEFWWFSVVHWSIVTVLYGAAQVVGSFLDVVFWAYIVLTAPPVLGVTIRRLHDSGKTGKWALIIFAQLVWQHMLAPGFRWYIEWEFWTLLIGGCTMIILDLVLLVLLALPGEKAPNRYGREP